MRENLDDEITEVKSENAIDRITSQANPRTLERVPAGARFNVRMVLDVLCEEDKALAARLIEGLRLLEDDALGGGGSRGSGRVRFSNLKLAWRSRSFYSSGAEEAEIAAGDLGQLQAAVNDSSFGEKLASKKCPLFCSSACGPSGPGASVLIPAIAIASIASTTATRCTPRSRPPWPGWAMLDEWLAATASVRRSRQCASVRVFRIRTRRCWSRRRKSVAAAAVVQGSLERRALRALGVVESLAAGKALSEDGWTVDGDSECLLPFATPPVPGPFRVSVRSSAAVDRDGDAVTPHSAACLEFTPGSGLWCVCQFSDDAARERWTEPLTAAIRLLAIPDSAASVRGVGAARRCPSSATGWANFTFLRANRRTARTGCSRCSTRPPRTRSIGQGNYSLTTRGGRVESEARWGDPKKHTRMVAEGSVLVAAAEPRGAAADVAPDGFPHPVYRAGFALAIPIPLLVNRQAAS